MKRFIDGFRCEACGSSLGRHQDKSGLIDQVCFVCGVGRRELRSLIDEAEDYPDAMRLLGITPGHVSQILPRLNTPVPVQIRIDSNPLCGFDRFSEFLSKRFLHEAYYSLTETQVMLFERIKFDSIFSRSSQRIARLRARRHQAALLSAPS
jgi:hypothetical protein